MLDKTARYVFHHAMLKHLTVDEMVALIAPWVDPQRLLPVFTSIPEIASLQQHVTEAHHAVVSVRSNKGTSPELAAILQDGETIDVRHDHYARGVSLGLESHAQLCLAQDPPQTGRAERCMAIQAKLFPAGLAVINTSWLAESGNTERVKHLIEQEEPAIAEFLKTIPAFDATQTQLDVVHQWITQGTRLGHIENKKDDMAAKMATSAITKATINAARSKWFRVVGLVLGALEISNADVVAIEKIRGPVLRAAERAGERYAGPNGAAPNVENAGGVAEVEGAASTNTATD